MNDQIFETVVTTCSSAGVPHVAPMGIRYRDGQVVLMPYRPSTTLDNIIATQRAVLNIVVDTRVYAGSVTGRKVWPTVAAERIEGVRLACAISHVELQLVQRTDEAQRTVLLLDRVHEAMHTPFVGLNRAQAAVVEAAVLVSRLHMLPPEKIDTEMAYLQIAIDKTAGPEEHEAWGWLRDAVERHRAESARTSTP
jgi:hypothetical protein